MLAKCARMARRASTAPIAGGAPMSTGESPINKNMNMTATPTMKAVTWFRPKLEAHIPMAAKAAVSSAAPAYCATTTPTGRSAPRLKPRGMGMVSTRPSQMNDTWPRYLPTRSSSSVTGWASTTSIVPARISSANAPMVTAGTNSSINQGRISSIGRSVATPKRKADRKNRKSFSATKTTSRMYPVG